VAKRAHSKSVLRDHGMVQCRVRLPVSPHKNMNKKILLIPGWMRSVAYYKKYEGIDIWKENIPDEMNIEADYVVAHSLGSVVALQNWQKFPRTKLILVNPLVLKRSFWEWMWRWIKFALDEGPRIDKNVGILKIFSGLKKFYQLSKIDATGILKNISANDLVIMRGCRDKFFCDNEASGYLKKNGLSLIEIEEAAHHWNEKFDIEIDKITKDMVK